jgi:cytochrome c-type biogenesis protein CcmH/NrfG
MVEPIGDVLDRAAQLSASGRRRKAVALLRSTANSHPDSAEVWCRLAAALLDRGDAAAALDAVRRASALPGDSAWTHRLASKALSRLARHEEAVAAARQAVRAAPSDWRCRVALAEAFGAAGLWSSAQDAAAEAVRLEPDHVRPYLVLGDAARRTGDIVTAERAYRTAMRRKPGDARVRAELARLRQPSPSQTGAIANFAENHNFAAIHEPDRPSVSDAPLGGRRSTRPWADGWSAPNRWQPPRFPLAAPDRSAAEDLAVEDPAVGRTSAFRRNRAFRRTSGRGRTPVGDRLSADGRASDPGRTPNAGRPPSDRRAATGRNSDRRDAGRRATDHRNSDRRDADRRHVGGGRAGGDRWAASDDRATGDRRSPVPEKLAWRGIRQLSMTLVIAGMFLMVAGLPKPTPVLAWLGFAIPCVVVVLALVELIRVPAGSRFAVLTMPLRRPVIGLSCVLLALSNALVLLWAMLDRANAGTMEPLIFALVCAVCAGAVSLVSEA